MNRSLTLARRYGGSAGALFAIVAIDRWIIQVNAITAALYLLLIVLGAAALWGIWESVFASLVGMLIFNFFFLPPVGAFTIADPENWVALFAFLATAITASKLSSGAKQRTEEALAGRNEAARLYELGRALLMHEGRDSVRQSVLQTSQILGVPELAFFDRAANEIYGPLEELKVARADLERVARAGEPLLRPEAAVIPVRMGSDVVGSLAFGDSKISPGARDAAANLLAIAYERARALDRAAAAEIARRNEEFKSSLLDGIAHDLKTPLTAIRSCITRLIQIPPRTEAVRQELLSIIDQESARLQISINEALELARIESNQLNLAVQKTNVASLIASAIAQTRDEDAARYSSEIPANLEMDVDPNLMRRALTQIVENAKKYSPPGSPIVIRADRNTISVRDHGPGFQKDELDKVFNKFYRGRSGRDKTEGTGMGLAIANAIVRAHGGNIIAENRPGGAAIVIMLPHE